jgi:hypothetical protein
MKIRRATKRANSTRVEPVREFEEIDEISKKTLGSYIRAAVGDREIKKIRARQISDMGHERKDAGDHQSAQKHFMKAGELAGKAANRKAGINKAVDRLTKEEAEQVDEVSIDTLKSYHAAAKTQTLSIADKLKKVNSKEITPEKGKVKSMLKTYSKRRGGMHMAKYKAGKKVMGEEVEEEVWPVYARLLEKRANDPHTKGATPPQPHGDNWAGRDKEFNALHGGTGARKPPYFADDHGMTAVIDDNDDDTSTKNIKKSPGRPNDKDVGDKVADKPTDHPEYKSPWPVVKPTT